MPPHHSSTTQDPQAGRPGHLTPGQEHMVEKLRVDVRVVFPNKLTN